MNFMRDKLKAIIEDNTTVLGRRFDYFILVMIFVSLADFSIDTLPNNPPIVSLILEYVELFCVVIFSIEFVLRLYVSDKPLKYFFSFFGLIDFIAILPYYLGLAIDLRSVRAFRVLRVFRALKIVRYNKALNRFHLAAQIVKEEIILFFMIPRNYTSKT